MASPANATLFGLMSFGRALGICGSLLVLLLVLVRPEASLGLDVMQRTLYWSLHVGAGLIALWAASRALISLNRLGVPLLLQLLCCALLGIVMAAPVFATIEYLWPTLANAEPDSALDRLAARGPVRAALVETIEAGPWVLVLWMLINLPVLIGTLGTDQTPGIGMDDRIDTPPPMSSPRLAVVERHAERGGNAGDGRVPRRFLQSLPGYFGGDVIAVGSDLHYLNVFTMAGRTTVLGSLADVSAELADRGMQVHRSHWVAHAHVQRIVNTGGSAACILTNGLRVPVSRRRWKAVREFYGQGVLQRHASGGS